MKAIKRSRTEKITVICPPETAERLRDYQEKIKQQTGLNLSLSMAAASLLHRGLEQAET